MDRPPTIIATSANRGLFSPTLGDISAVIERRMSWYTVSSLTMDSVELRDGRSVVVHLRDDATNTFYREVIDARTGRLIKRDLLQTSPARLRTDRMGRSRWRPPIGRRQRQGHGGPLLRLNA